MFGKSSQYHFTRIKEKENDKQRIKNKEYIRIKIEQGTFFAG